MTFFYYSCILLVIGVDSASIFCLIHTATPSHATRAHTILETWAKRCDDFIFFTDSPMSADIPHIYWKELHSRDHSWEKIRRIFNHVVDEMEDEYDWYLRADDDAYVIVENLRHFLANYSSKEPHYFGYRWNFFVPHGYADGGVYVLSRPAVEVFNRVMEDPKLCPELHRAEEDQEGFLMKAAYGFLAFKERIFTESVNVMMGRCLAAAGIYPEDTRDENGSDRFHHFHPTEQLVMYKDPFARKNAYYPPLKGANNFSPQMIGFHHLSPYEMRVFDYFLYKLKRRAS